jgi:hypothetical protein
MTQENYNAIVIGLGQSGPSLAARLSTRLTEGLPDLLREVKMLPHASCIQRGLSVLIFAGVSL